MNKVLTSGIAVGAPQVRMAGETPVANYTLAVRRRGAKDGKADTDFIRFTAFGPLATFAEKYIEKGTSLNVVGHIQTGSYTDKDGKTVYTTDIIVEEQEFAGRKPTASTES